MIHEIQSAFRSAWRNKVFSLTTLIVFAFGIGSTATVFSVIDAVILRPAAFPNAGSVVALQSRTEDHEWGDPTPRIYEELRARSGLFSQVTGTRTAIYTVTGVPAPDQVLGLTVSGNFFALAGARPWRGRLLTPQDDRVGAPAVALLSYGGAQQLFAGNVEVVGKTAEIDGDMYTVVGVMAPDFVLPGKTGKLWTALRLTNEEISAPNARGITVTARLQPSLNLAKAQVALDVSSKHEATPQRFRVSQWQDEADPSRRLTLWLAMGMVSGLLLIGCANISSVLLARSTASRREYAIRMATGASRARLVRQLLLEISIVAVAALPGAWIGASGALKWIRDHLVSAPISIPDLARVKLNGASILFSFGVALLAAVFSGILPASSSTRVDLYTGLRESGTQAAGTLGVRRFLRLLIGAEAGIAMILLLTSGLLLRSLVRLMSEDHGLRVDHVLTLHLPTGSYQRLSKFQTPEERQGRIRQYLRLMREVRATSGVEAAALASSIPLSHVAVRTHFAPPHRRSSAEASVIAPITQSVSRDYFRVMGIPVISGRTFESRDAASKLPVALVNQAFVRSYFSGENPVGKYLRSGDSKDETKVVGVTKDSPHLDLNEVVEPEVYLDFEQSLLMAFLTGLVVRTSQDPQVMIPSLRGAVMREDPAQAVVQVQTLRSLVDENVARPRFSAWLFSALGGIALCLAGIGIFGVVGYVATSRRRDFGIRLALGANAASLFRLTILESLLPVIAGTGAGVLISYWTSHFIASLLYRTSSFDLPAVFGSAGILLIIAFIATAGPALRAARVDPAITLRYE